MAGGIGFAGFVGFERAKHAKCQRTAQWPEPILRTPPGGRKLGSRGNDRVPRDFFISAKLGIAIMVEKLCLKCRKPLESHGRRPAADYCSTGCRRAAEFELRRIQRHLERLEAQRESPFFARIPNAPSPRWRRGCARYSKTRTETSAQQMAGSMPRFDP